MSSMFAGLAMMVCAFAAVYLYLTNGNPVWIALDVGFVVLNLGVLISSACNSCESDNNPRPTEKSWIEGVISQCRYFGTKVFLKQLGGNKKCTCHNAWGCRLWNGQTIDEIPLLTEVAKS